MKAAGVDPLMHFDQSGWREGRLPSLNFGVREYLSANPDVAAAGIDPLRHYLEFGYQEGREPVPPTVLLNSGGFDYVYYLQHNPDVAAAGVDPLQHFQQFGWREGRNPNALFDVNGYLATYADVNAGGHRSARALSTVRMEGGARSIGELRYHGLSRRLSGRGGRADRSAGAFPPVRDAGGPPAFADGVWG